MCIKKKEICSLRFISFLLCSSSLICCSSFILAQEPPPSLPLPCLPLASICCLCCIISFLGRVALPSYFTSVYPPPSWWTCYLCNLESVSLAKMCALERRHVCYSYYYAGSEIAFLILALLCLFNLSPFCSSPFENSLTPVIMVWTCNRLAGPSDFCGTSQEWGNMCRSFSAKGLPLVFLCSHHQMRPGTSQNESTACLLTY